jgi:hypothetical protein
MAGVVPLARHPDPEPHLRVRRGVGAAVPGGEFSSVGRVAHVQDARLPRDLPVAGVCCELPRGATQNKAAPLAPPYRYPHPHPSIHENVSTAAAHAKPLQRCTNNANYDHATNVPVQPTHRPQLYANQHPTTTSGPRSVLTPRMGAVDAGRKTAAKVLKEGLSVAVYPGGSREIFSTAGLGGAGGSHTSYSFFTF